MDAVAYRPKATHAGLTWELHVGNAGEAAVRAVLVWARVRSLRGSGARAQFVEAYYAVMQGVGLWLLKRCGEYFAVVATSIFLPLEIHDLAAKGITFTRGLTFAINVAAVIYLLVSKRLLGLRGGRKACDEERRGEQILDVEQAAARP